jgi:hypothetical protein
MIRSALILGAVSFIYMLVANIVQNSCAPCLAVLLGLAAGALAAVFDKPAAANKAAVSGALAAWIASIGAVLGTVAGLAIRIFAIFGPNTFAEIIPGMNYSQSDINLGLFFTFCCCAAIPFLLMAASGALGGFLWFRLAKPQPSAPPPIPAG